MMRFGKAVVLCILLFSCNSDYTPKPREYFRIDFPERKYQLFDKAGYPYQFEYPVYSKIGKDTTLFDDNPDNPYWINIDFPEFKARIYLSYKTIGGNSIYKVKTENGYKDSSVKNSFEGLRDEAFKMTYKHSLKASSIDDSSFTTANGISGVYFTVGGNAATANQFFMTDSSRHFLRGALYFDSAPNSDSLAPVIGFLKEDLKHMIGTLKWK